MVSTEWLKNIQFKKQKANTKASSGEFVGMVADNPDCKIELRTFHSEILNDHDALRKEQKHFKPVPIISEVTQEMISENYFKIRQQVVDLIETEIEIQLNTLSDEVMIIDSPE